MTPSLSLDLSQLEQLIRGGRGVDARETLLGLRAGDIKPSDRWKYAALCRRVSLYQKGLEILRESFYEVRDKNLADENILGEYAALLTEVGATAIAEKIFRKIASPSGLTHLYLGLHQMKQWEYENAQTHLEDFLRAGLEPYWKRIGMLNLASCLIFNGEYPKARAWLSQLTEERSQLSAMAQGSLDELEGQVLFLQGQTQEARAHFISAFEKLKASNNPAALFAEKWIYICRLSDPNDTSVESEILDFKRVIRKIGAWEILRELDRFQAKRHGNTELLHKLYFGTPHKAYRKMLKRDFNYSPPAHFPYRLGNGSKFEGTLRLGEMSFASSRGVFRKFPASAKKLLSGLLHDLYRPRAVGSLFELLFSGEFFDPEFGPAKTYQAIKRFRALCAKEELPFEIESADLGFTLAVRGHIFVEYDGLGEFSRRESNDANVLHLIHGSFAKDPFNVAELAAKTSMSTRTLNRVLAELIKSGEIEAFGEGRGRRYKLCKAA